MFDEKTLQARQDDELRARCQRLADELTAPLPQGDPGIFEMLARWEQYNALLDDKAGPLYRIDVRQETAIVLPIFVDAAGAFLGDAIDAGEPEGPQAAAALVRHYLHCAQDDPDDWVMLPARLLLRVLAMTERFMSNPA